MSAHTCHAKGRTTPVPPKRFMCRVHWFSLPKSMQDAIWAVYRPGQEVRKDPSPEYLETAQAAINWLADKEAARTR